MASLNHPKSQYSLTILFYCFPKIARFLRRSSASPVAGLCTCRWKIIEPKNSSAKRLVSRYPLSWTDSLPPTIFYLLFNPAICSVSLGFRRSRAGSRQSGPFSSNIGGVQCCFRQPRSGGQRAEGSIGIEHQQQRACNERPDPFG